MKPQARLGPASRGTSWWLAGAAFAGVAHIITDIAAGDLVVGFILKALPIWILSALVFREARTTRDRGAWLIGIGLLIGSVGDIFLALGSLVPGLASFLVGHLFYMAAWLREFRFEAKRATIAIGLMGIALEIAWWLSADLPPNLVIPVYAYVLTIALMSGLAFLRSRPSLIVPLGTVLFIVSDTINATHRFKFPIPLVGLWVMLAYYVAQGMIAIGYLRERR